MKTLRMIGMAVMAVIISFGMTACSSDDDDDKDNGGATSSIVGKWQLYKVVTVEGTVSMKDTYEFKADKSFVWSYYDEDINGFEVTTNNTYEVKGNELRLNLNITNGVPDDYTVGTFTISGDEAVYKYTWHDGAGQWDNTDVETAYLKRMK